jgi:hypothetical protein
MGKQEFAKVLEGIINDAGAAERVAGGDFADLDGGELTDAEQALLTAAAGDLDDEVTGFGDSFLKLGDIDGESWKIEKADNSWVEIEAAYNVRNAMGYLKLGDISGE